MPHLKPLFATAEPRPANQTGEAYAANLSQALRQEVHTAAGAHAFLEGTYPTEAMRTVCRQVMGRLSLGAEAHSPGVYTFHAGFGGGKTHTGIALAAMARHPRVLHGLSDACRLVDPDLASACATVVAINGQDARSNGDIHLGNDRYAPTIAEAVRMHLVPEAEPDRGRRGSPGAAGMAAWLGDKPVLILIDELVLLLNKLHVEQRVRDAEAVAATLNDLANAVSGSPRAVMILTTPEAGADAFQDETLKVLDILNNLDSLMARVAHSVTPSSGDDVPHILRRRLFRAWDETERNRAADAYADLHARRGDAERDELRAEFHACYPFHPGLIGLANDRLAGNPNFQKVRGTLRLFNEVIRMQRDLDMPDAILHPHHVDPRDPVIRDQFTGRVGNEELLVGIRADIEDERHDDVRCAHMAAVTIMLGSVSPSATRGLHRHEVLEYMLSPRLADRGVLERAIDSVVERGLYIDHDPGRGLFFSNEPSLQKLAQDRMRSLRQDTERLRQDVDDAVLDAFRPRHQPPFDVQLWPSPSRNLPDTNDRIRLGVLNPEYLHAGSANLEAELSALHRHTSGDGGRTPRRHLNQVMFLVASEPDLYDLERTIIARNAYADLAGNPELNTRRATEAREKHTQAGKEVFVSVQRLWNALFVPAGHNTLGPDSRLRRIGLGGMDRAGQGAAHIVATLQQKDMLVSEPHLNPNEWHRRPDLTGNKAPTVAEIYSDFTCTPARLKFVCKGDFLQAVGKGVEDGTLGLVTPHGLRYAPGSRAPAPLGDDCRVYLAKYMPAEDQPKDKPKPPPPAKPDLNVFTDAGPGRLVVIELDRYLARHERSRSDVARLTLRHTDHRLLNDLAGIWQGTDKAALSWTCTNTDRKVFLQLEDRTADWWMKHRRQLTGCHDLAGRPADGDVKAELDCPAHPELLDATLQALERHGDVDVTASVPPKPKEDAP